MSQKYIDGIAPPVAPPKFENGPHACEVRIRVTDRMAFKDYVEIDSLNNSEALTRALQDAMFEPFQMGDFGARLCDFEARYGGGEILVRLEVEIADACLFNQQIALAGRRSGFEDDWTPEDAGSAIFEAWCGCNDTPSPSDMGLSIEDWNEVEIEPEEGLTP